MRLRRFGPALLLLLVAFAGCVAPSERPWEKESGDEIPGEEPADTPAPLAVRYVSPSGDDGNDGSEHAPWATVDRAVAGVEPGTKIVVLPGTYPGFRVDRIDGTEEAPIWIAGTEEGRPVFTGPVRVERAHWILEGIEIASRDPDEFSFRFTGEGAHDVVLRRSVIRDGAGRAGISVDLGASRIRIEENEIFGIDRGDEDAHGIVVQPTVSDVAIVGNEIHDNSGDSVQCIGPGQDAVEGSPANGLRIEGNTLYANRENAIDIKRCENVTIRDNVLYGFRASSTSKGEAVVVHLLARNVVVEGNDISDASRGVVTGRGASEVVVRRNVIHDLADERTAVIFGEGSGFAAIHNTIVGAVRGVQALEGSGVPVVRNNLFEAVAEPVVGEAAVERNLFSGSPPTGSEAIEGGADLDEGFVPGERSAALDGALPGDDGEACGGGPDLGARERC